MALVDLKARLIADPTGFQAGVSAAQRSLNSFEARARTGAASMTAGFGALTRAFGPLLAVFSAFQLASSQFNQAREFESAMGVIEAASGQTGRALAEAELAIRSLGVATGFGARQAAEAAEELLKAGLSIRDLTGGALEAAITLAAATGGTMAEGANIAVRAMQNFGLEAEDLQRVIQGAAGVINATTFDLNDYSLAIGQAANSAGAYGVTLEDFNATLALTASAFSSGSDAGTSFKTFLQRLVPQSEEAAQAMEDLQFSAFDANGEFVGMEELVSRLTVSFAGLTTQERARAIVTIFGSDAQRTANALITQGSESLREMRDVTLQQADAQAMAAARWQGVNGALARLSANWEELSITIAQSGMQGAIASIIGVVTQAVSWLTRLIQQFHELNNLGTPGANSRETYSRIVAAQRAIGQIEADLETAQSRVGDPLWPRAAEGVANIRARLQERQRQLAALYREWQTQVTNEARPRDADNMSDAARAEMDAAIAAAEEYAARIAAGSGGGNASAQREEQERLEQHLQRMRELWSTADGEIDTERMQREDELNAWLEEMFGARENTLAQNLGLMAERLGDSFFDGLEKAFVTGDWSNLKDTLLRDFMQIIWDVFIGDELRQWIETVVKSLKAIIDNALSNIFSTAGGGGGIWGTITSAFGSLFGGRATGGPVSGSVIVGEHGPELFDPHGGSGNIVPLARSFPGGGSGVTINYAPTIDARGVDAAQVARLEQQQRALLENMEPLVIGIVNGGLSRRKIG